MRILLCHNEYRQPGGEDQVFADERFLLESNGHEVATYVRTNREIERRTLRTAIDTVWNQNAHDDLRRLIRDHQPEIVHFHNTFPIISPAAYYAATEAGIPVIQTLHNFRLICAKAVLMRNGDTCEDCVGKSVAWSAIRHRCYQGSLGASIVTTAMLATHWRMGTWQSAVSKYIALTEFARDKFIAGGLPAERIAVKPNCVRPAPLLGTNDGGFAIFVGRLAEEKGIRVLLDAWIRMSERGRDVWPLHIVGDGPLRPMVEQAIRRGADIRLLGQQSHLETLEQIRRAEALIFPSIWHEGFGRSVIEAFAAGAPVIATDLAPMSHIVQHDETGILFPRGDANALATSVRRLYRDTSLWWRLRNNARQQFERLYTPERNYELLMAVYRNALNQPPPEASPSEAPTTAERSDHESHASC